MAMSVTDYKNTTYESDMNEIHIEQLYSKVDILYFLLDSASSIVSCNNTVLETLDLDKEQVLGKNFLDFAHPCSQDLLQSEIARCRQRGFIRSVSSVLMRHSGKPVHVRLNGLSATEADPEARSVRLYVQDVSGLIRSEQRKALMSRLLKIALQSGPTERILKEILADIQKHLDCDGIGLSLQKSSGEKQSMGNWKGFDEALPEKDFRRWTPEKWKLLADRLCVDDRSGGSGENRLLIDDAADVAPRDSDSGTSALLAAFGNYRSVGAVPMQRETVSGYLIFADRKPHGFDADDIGFLEEVAGLLPDFMHKPAFPSKPTPAAPPAAFRMPNLPFAGILVTRNGLIDQSNSWVQRFLGAEEDLLRGKLLVEFIDPDFQHALLDSQAQNSMDSVKLKVWTLEGKARFVLCATEKAASSSTEEQVWYWMDIPELIDPKQRLLHSKKMETLGLLAGSIVLDFNNHLACILGYSSLLGEEISPGSPHYQDLQQIVATTEKSVELTSRLLACAQGSPYVVSNLDVNPLINEVAGIMSKTFPKDLLIRAELDPKLHTVHGDASRLQQSFLEIALNAKEAMPTGGKIVFQTRNIALGEKDLKSRQNLHPGDYIQITISDTGYGMTADLKKQVFDSESDVASEGGVGLILVRQIVEEHRGFISVFSEKAQGTVFKITLPVQTEPARNPVEIKTGELSSGRETILLVDDEAMLRDTGQQMLRRYGYQVIPAENGTQAVELYRKYGSKIDLIILDMLLPGVEINKILEWLYKFNPRTKILASVGKGERDSVEKSLRFDVTGYVQKPFHIRPLIHSIRATLNA
jgi:PAS domain S-box-containing protein